MCLDLFAEEYGDGSFIPGPRRSGRDRAADGVYEGKLGNHGRGKWKIACAIRQDANSLKAKIRIERASAIKGKFDGMVVMTPLDVDAPTVSALSSEGRKGLRWCLVWPRSTLERLLRKHPWVASVYFGHQLLPGFIPLGAQGQHELKDQPDLTLVGRSTESNRIKTFMAGNVPVLLVVAPGGSGKSRLLREVPPLARAAKQRRSSWLRRPGIGTVEDGLRSGLPIRSPLLIALDDAGRALDEVRQLATLVHHPGPYINAKAIFALRPADRELVERELQTVGVAYELMELARISTEDVTRIAILDAPTLSPRLAGNLAKHLGSNLFLLRAAARLVRDGESPARILEADHLRGLVAERFLAEAASHLKPLSQEGQAQQIVLQAALDVPIRQEEASPELETLLEAGLLRRVGNTLRFRADVEGDLLLSFLLRRPWARAWISKNLKNPKQHFLNRIRNIAAAGTGHPAEIIRKVCDEWLATAGSTEHSERAEILAVLPWCVASAADQVVRICEAYAATNGTHTTDEFGPVVGELARAKGAVAALRLFRQLHVLGVKAGTFATYKLPGLVEEIGSLHNVSPEEAAELCGEVERFLDMAPLVFGAEVSEALLNVFLAPTANWETSEPTSVTMHEQELTSTPAVLSVRERAMRILRKMLSHDNRDVRLAATNVLSEHAHAHGRRTSAKALDAVREEEFRALVPILRERLQTETDIRVLDALEQGLVFRWAGQTHGADESSELLRSTEWPLLLTALRLVVRPWEFYFDIKEVMAGAPDDKRWDWWIEQRVHHIEAGAEELEKVAALVASKYTTAEELRSAVRSLSVVRDRSPVALLDAWCSRNPKLFQMALQNSQDGEVQDFLRRALRRHRFAAPAFDRVGEVQRLVSEKTSEPVLRAALGDMPRLTTNEAVSVARALVAESPLELRQLGLDLLQYRADISKDVVLEILELALRDGKWTSVWYFVWSVLHDQAGRDALIQRPSLEDAIQKRVSEMLVAKDSHLNSNQEWYVHQIIDVLVGKDVAKRVAMFARLQGSSSWYLEGLAGNVIKPLLMTPEGLHALVTSVGALLNQETITPRGWSRALARAIDDHELEPFARGVAEACLANPDSGIRQAALAVLSEMRRDADACLKVVELAVGSDPLNERALNTLSNFTQTRGAYSSEIGSAPPAFMAMQRTLEIAASKTTDAAVTTKLSELSRIVAAKIAEHLRNDEEMLDPR